MQVTKWVAVTLTVLLLGGKVFAQSVDDIIAKNIDAMGGQDKLATLNTVYEETTSSIMGNDLPAKIWVVNNVGFRMEMEMMGSKMVTVVNKDKGWMINPMAGSTDPQPLPDEAVKTFARRMTLGGAFFNYKDRGYTATLVGKESVNGKDTYKIKMTKTGEPDATYYVDATTYYVDKSSTTTFMNGQSVEQDIIFTDYKKTPEGFVLPNSYTMELPQGELVTTMTKVVFNQPIDTTKFQNP
ncbi:LolA-like protein [Dinghuibacter silviterrae]|uniref:Outer membrane lipoprotein-sorting protein n=1 Tax=Dinghuibacter silviterrae TaxID=1539049 RepID=A0A4R8DNP5_9BACT|nr:DUF4292 domain-containing protein [Dinghuibacter silviterrae]TDW99327.1 hypothetical protein EDB95_0336 [Dinghuibacter silviterrae]